MDLGDLEHDDGFRDKLPRVLPADLPKSLDDRIQLPHLHTEHEVYDAWQCISPGPTFMNLADYAPSGDAKRARDW